MSGLFGAVGAGKPHGRLLSNVGHVVKGLCCLPLIKAARQPS